MTDAPRSIAPTVLRSLQTLPDDPRFAGLQALALRLAVDLDEAREPRAVTALAGQLRAVLVDLQLVPTGPVPAHTPEEATDERSTVLDGLRARRATRAHRAAALDPPTP